MKTKCCGKYQKRLKAWLLRLDELPDVETIQEVLGCSHDRKTV